tara:strand:+ start:1426 stop:2496 length:1071 start_codon:yes stop_codon:yes gene_type:complete
MPFTRPKAAQIDFDVTNISDPLIRLNSGESGSADKDSGIVIERGSDTNVAIIYDESADQFAVVNTSETGTTSGNITISGYADIKANAFHGDGSNLTGLSSGGAFTAESDGASLTDTSTGSSAGPVITLTRNPSDNAGSDADYLGQLKFKGDNDAGQSTVFAKITGKIDDASDGTEDGILEFAHQKAGSNVITGRWKSDKLQLINGTSLEVDGDVTATVFTGTATSARYADLAEKYLADNLYQPGTVLQFGGHNEVTETKRPTNIAIAGVVSTNPAHLMNSELYGEFVVELALLGRVPCNVVGKVNKGDLLVSSDIPGYACAYGEINNPPAGSVIGKSIQDKHDIEQGIIEVLVGRL